MREVIATLQFNTPALGNRRDKDPHEMLRNSAGKVIFLPTWWRKVFCDASQAVSRYQNFAKKIKVDPEVDGEISVYKRYYAKDKYTRHEAFIRGTVVKVAFLVPSKLTDEGLERLLNVVGKYIGISPYTRGEDWGRFSVLEINSGHRNNEDDEPDSDQAGASPEAPDDTVTELSAKGEN